MGRTEVAAGGDESDWKQRRSMMRFKSLTNSAKHVDEKLRREYAEVNPNDEWALYLGVRVFGGKLLPTIIGTLIPAQEVNHVYSNPRRDLWSNFMAQTRDGHRWFHDNIQTGRMLCVLAKARKAMDLGDPRECDISKLDLCCGRSVIGIMENYDCGSNAMLEKMKSETIRRLLEIQSLTNRACARSAELAK
jgi:hypothetical protein